MRSPVRAPLELQATESAIRALHPTRRPVVISQDLAIQVRALLFDTPLFGSLFAAVKSVMGNQISISKVEAEG